MLRNCHCHTRKNVAVNSMNFSMISSVMIALIPKCPFCIMAYSSAITVCGGKSFQGYSPEWTSFISISLAIVPLILILMNYRGKRTLVAFGILLSGILLIIYSEIITGNLTTYYYGGALLIFGIWYNSSFLFFYYKIKDMVKAGTMAVNKRHCASR